MSKCSNVYVEDPAIHLVYIRLQVQMSRPKVNNTWHSLETGYMGPNEFSKQVLGISLLMVSLDHPQTYGLAEVLFWFEGWNCAISIGLMIVSLREGLVLIREHLFFD